jgi:hypothetical protein
MVFGECKHYVMFWDKILGLSAVKNVPRETFLAKSALP